MQSSQQEAVFAMFASWKRGEVELAPVTGLLGIAPVEIGEGRAALEMDAGKAHHNVFGTVHGGLLCAFADVAMGVALAATLDNEGFTTLHQQMDHVRGIVESRLLASAEVTHRGRRIGHLRCAISDDRDRLIAEASSVCLISELEAGI